MLIRITTPRLEHFRLVYGVGLWCLSQTAISLLNLMLFSSYWWIVASCNPHRHHGLFFLQSIVRLARTTLSHFVTLQSCTDKKCFQRTIWSCFRFAQRAQSKIFLRPYIRILCRSSRTKDRQIGVIAQSSEHKEVSWQNKPVRQKKFFSNLTTTQQVTLIHFFKKDGRPSQSH